MADDKYVYFFGEGKKEMKELLGGKGANLAEMTNLGIPVPPGFTITTQVCELFYMNNKNYPEGTEEQIKENLIKLEEKMGSEFGGSENPLLLSVRSGAAVSMPGMMDTVLNLGLNEKTLAGLIKKTGNESFCWDCYRRFIQMFGDVVMGIDHSKFEHILESVKRDSGIEYDKDLSISDLKRVVEGYKELYRKETDENFPEDPKLQLRKSIDAVFGSWNNERAISYRRLNRITGLIGTAVNVQAMVFGNMGKESGTGVCFSRNPSNGEREFYGEYLMDAQGEDVVAGIRTPNPILSLEKQNPEIYRELVEIKDKLERHYRDIQDMEFTIQEGKLYILQTRNGKRTARAAVKAAVDMSREGLITEEEAILRVDPEQLNQLLHKTIDPVAKSEAYILAEGFPASPGAAVGRVVFSAKKAKDMVEQGESVVLVRTETSPEDIEGMDAAQGILTSRGGMTSHAAVVARGMGKCCVAGCGSIEVNEEQKFFVTKDGLETIEGDWITLEGNSGEILKGKVRVVEPTLNEDFSILMEWADKYRKLEVRTNADTPHDSTIAIKFGAQGIGLCRTEHMFFEESRIKAVREMILSCDLDGRKRALAKILPMQQSDFKSIFRVMDGKPVTIRLIDPPLHEFLPKEEEDIESLASEMKLTRDRLKSKINELHEFNPMLGHRGCRLAISHPEIAEMQTEAIIRAAIETSKEGIDVRPEIMIPLIGGRNELRFVKKIVNETARRVIDELGSDIKYSVGAMIEVPRGALIADKLTSESDFFSFGTNDLTQMTCGFSRDDATKFLKEYVKKGITKQDPFQSLDQDGVGMLVKSACEKSRGVNRNIKLGVCGEHGGEPASIEFFHRTGLDYVSCSPYRVPIARLAAAQAAIRFN